MQDDKLSTQTTKWRYEIIVDLSEEDDPHAVFRRFEDLLNELGQVGALSMRCFPDGD